jgi:hypothetical protein
MGDPFAFLIHAVRSFSDREVKDHEFAGTHNVVHGSVGYNKLPIGKSKGARRFKGDGEVFLKIPFKLLKLHIVDGVSVECEYGL